MKLSRTRRLTFALILVSGILIAPINMYSAHGSTSKVSPSRTAIFVGGDIHTLTYTADGLFVTGHLAGNVSIDGGVSWRVISSFNNADIMGWATTSSGYLAGGHTGLYRTTNRGKTFSRFDFYGKVSDVHSLGASKKTVYLGSPEVGFLKSVNAGKSWKLINSKFGQGFMGSILVDPKDPLRVIAPDMANGLVITLDGGKTWSKYGGPAGAMSVDWNPLNRKELVALGMDYGAITKNAGKTWVTFAVPNGTSAITFSPDGSKIYIAVWNESKAKVFSSGDEGKTWS